MTYRNAITVNSIKTLWCSWPVWLQVTLALVALWLAVRVGTIAGVLIVTLIGFN